ncbi:MAG TPA: RNA methyltransferase [Saprospiraceae bacterium]|nr:RNA methyltransferase [Saprospiraceae bacterium]
MLSHNQTKLLTALQVKKYRQKYRKFTVEGEKMAAELLTQQRVAVSAVFGLERWADENAALLQPFLDKFNPVSEAELKKVSGLTTPNRVLVVAELPDEPFSLQILQHDFCFYLDGIQDPGNLGAILRVADWFGLPAIVCSPDTVDAFSPKVVQASMGAFLRVQIWEMPLEDVLEQAPGLPVMGAVLGGDNIFQTALPSNGLVVIGNEGRGISPAVEALLTHRLTIPRHPSGGAESLNAAVAAGIFAAMLRN